MLLLHASDTIGKTKNLHPINKLDDFHLIYGSFLKAYGVKKLKILKLTDTGAYNLTGGISRELDSDDWDEIWK